MPDLAAARPVSGTPIETAWGQQVHDAVEGIQTGLATVTFSGVPLSATVAVTFPRAYVTPPIVVGSIDNQSGAPNTVVGVPSVTATGCTLQAQDVRGSNVTGTMTVGWIAIGTPA